ncbi:MAG TPA: hypothetical protein VF585_09790 [Chthoniobacterales bacterium]
MSRKVWFLLFIGVVAVHGLLFMMIKDGPVIPPQWRVPPPPEPSFKFDQAKYVDPETGEKMVVKEFTIRAPRETPPPGTPKP